MNTTGSLFFQFADSDGIFLIILDNLAQRDHSNILLNFVRDY